MGARIEVSPEVIARIEEMLDDGAPFSEITATVGVTAKWLTRRYPGRAWSAEEQRDFLHYIQRYRWVLNGDHTPRVSYNHKSSSSRGHQ